MDVLPIVKSKLVMPETPLRMLYSQKMKGFHIENKRITVITAQAGFGKTTTVLLALKKEREHIHWYRLEKEDAFLPIFYAHLIETLFIDMDKASLDCHRALSSVQNILEEYPIINAYICQDATYIKCGMKRIYLVFDDFHSVAENRAIVESLRYFAVNMPDFISIIVTSRIETNILTGKLSIDKKALSISERDLRFTREEAGKLISTIYKMQYTDEEADQIFDHSEGWIAGLYMICHNNIPPPTEQTGDNESMFKRYFREFFYKLDQGRQNILANLSILPDFSSDELKWLFSYEQADELLNWLEKSNLYVQKIYAEAVRFRFHSLFKQELKDILYEKTNEKGLHELYFQAANFYRNRGSEALAIKLLLCINKTDIATDIAKMKCVYDFDRGHLENIGEIINCFPEGVIMQNPYLLFFKSIAYQNVSHEISFSYATKALHMFRQQKDASYLMNAFGTILVIAFQTNNFEILKEATSCLPIARIILSGGSPLAKLMISMASGMVAQEKFTIATLLYKLLDRKKAPDSVWHYGYLMTKGILLYRTGKLGKSIHNFDFVLNHPVGLASDQWKITGLVSGHLALNLARDINKAKIAMTEFSILAEKYDSYFARGFAYRMAAFISYQTNDITSAIENIKKSSEAFDLSISPVLASTSRITEYFWISDCEEVKKIAEQSLSELDKMQNYEVGHGFYELCQTMTGAILIKAEHFDDAEKILLSALKTSRLKKAVQNICGTLTQLIYLYYIRGKEELLKKYLLKWAKLTTKNSYTFFWEVDRQTLIRSCALACKYNYFTKYMAKLIELYFGKEASENMLRNPDILAERPYVLIEQNQSLEQSKRKVFVKLFGKFKITTDGFEITDEAFKTRKISGVLKYILVNTEKPISRDILTAIFWPEVDEKPAFMSLRVALSELRKVLSKCNMAFDSTKAFLCENKNGFFVSDNNEIIFDTGEFIELYKLYKSITRDDKQKVDLLKKMIQIYEGDLLEDNLYEDWLMVPREHYRSIFIEASLALAITYIKEKTFGEAEIILNKHLKIEPLDEKACGMLLQVFQNTNQKSRAVAFKRQFEKRFFEEMGQKATF